MSRIMTVSINNVDPDAGDTMAVNCTLKTCDPDHEAGADFTINLKVLGVYRTPVQLNQAILGAAKQYAADEWSLATNSYDAAYVSGSLGLVL